MTHRTDTSWTELRPTLRSKASREDFLAHARALARIQRGENLEEAVDELRCAFAGAVTSSAPTDRQFLLAAGHVLADLVVQGWQLRAHGSRVELQAPTQVGEDRAAEKARIRRQELINRDAQLRRPAVRKFLRSMERIRIFKGKFTSIFSLLRDGRDLAEGLRKAREHSNNGWAGALASVVDPYVELVPSEEATCAFTGLRLMDIWRYFRHTWTNQYTSVPGRSMIFLVRDRTAPFHPIVGIGALSSPVMQIRERDTWIGWHPDTFLARIKASPTPELARWLVAVVDAAIAETYIDDLLEDGVLALRDLVDPSDAPIGQLLREGAEQRRLHHRYVRSRDHKGVRSELVS
jgi:Domain of unknown function (DUF4338)